MSFSTMDVLLTYLNLKEELSKVVAFRWALYLFILGVEILSEKIRTNICVKGIIAQENEVKISQYDHGTTVILDGSKESFYISSTGFGQFQRYIWPQA